MKARLLLALACTLGMLVATAAPAVAVEPVVVVDTDKPEVGPAASTTYLAWIVFSGKNLNPSIRAEAIGSDTSFRVNPQGTSASPAVSMAPRSSTSSSQSPRSLTS